MTEQPPKEDTIEAIKILKGPEDPEGPEPAWKIFFKKDPMISPSPSDSESDSAENKPESMKRAPSEPEVPHLKKPKNMNSENTKQEPSKDPNFRQCQYLVVRKNRLCRQRACKDSDYCGEHLLVSEQKDGNHGRIPCPLDPSHSCYSHLLENHLKKCNARKKPLPAYLVEGINGEDCELPSEKFNVHSVTDEELLSFISRIESLHREHVSKPVVFDGCHALITEELKSYKDCAMVEKHLSQQGALLEIMHEKKLLEPNQMFVEFGAGRGQLATWVMKSLGDDAVAQSSFVLIDRASQRYKADNRFVDKWGSSIHRMRADIRHLCLEKVGPFEKHEGRVVGFCKHLCGVAIDLALRCVTDTVGDARLPKGIVMAVCCHHRCEWRWYSGQAWLKKLGITDKDFQLMVSIAGWATCGSGSREEKGQRKDKAKKSEHSTQAGSSEERSTESEVFPGSSPEKTAPDQNKLEADVEKQNRYQTMGLSIVRRHRIGFMVKAIIDEGRLQYLTSKGLKAERYKFIDEKYTPENFAIVATQ